MAAADRGATTALINEERTLAEADWINIGNGKNFIANIKAEESKEFIKPNIMAGTASLQTIDHQRPVTKDLLARIASSPCFPSKITT